MLASLAEPGTRESDMLTQLCSEKVEKCRLVNWCCFNVWQVFSGRKQVLERFPGGPVIRSLMFMQLKVAVAVIVATDFS